jgi:hypothetical protein
MGGGGWRGVPGRLAPLQEVAVGRLVASSWRGPVRIVGRAWPGRLSYAGLIGQTTPSPA